MKHITMTSVAALTILASNAASAATLHPGSDAFLDFEKMEYLPPAVGDTSPGQNGVTPLLASSIGAQRAAVGFTPTSRVLKSFEGISQYDVASYGRNFVPPDTMGAVGKSQFTQFANGGFAVFGKDGTVQKATSDNDFWVAAGQPLDAKNTYSCGAAACSTNGDSRVMYNKAANRWVALAFGSSVSDIQIAVSNTSDAAGTWRSTKFTGFAGGTADYPTLAIDTNAVYIGTNNFNGDGSFGGTTLNVIPLSSLVSGSAPTTAGLKKFVTPYNATTGGRDGGYAIQGVNSETVTTTGRTESASLFYTNLLRTDITNVGTAGAKRTNFTYLDNPDYNDSNPGRQPNAVPDIQGQPATIPGPTPGTFVPNPNYHPSNDRIVDTLDSRIGSSVYEVNGRIYSVHTVTPIGKDYSVVRWDVVDAATNTLLAEGDIGDATHDYYQGSLSVNAKGQVVIAYNRSGSSADGKISFLARVFSTDANGHLTQRGAEELLKVSLVDDYHNGSIDGFVGVGRQRWGDYSQVTVDPTDSSHFWVIGQFAREYNDPAGGHPVGTGGSRWGTWISEVGAGNFVPEPATWMMMITGFGLVGAMARRRSRGYATA